MRKLLVVSTPFNPTPPTIYGGSERVAHCQAEGFKRAGWTVKLIAKPGSQNYGGGLIPCFQWKSHVAAHLSFMIMSWRVVLAARGASGVLNNYLPRWVFLFRFLIRPPILQWFHNEYAIDLFTRVLLRKDDKFIFVSRSAMRKGIASGAPIERSVFIYNAIDTDFFFPVSDQKKNFILYVGRITEEKGVTLAMAAAKSAGVKLVLAGIVLPSDKEYFDKVVSPEIKADVCEFIGPVDDTQKRDWMRAASGVLMPSQVDETFGLVAAEALACGTPVIVSNRGALPEVVVHESTGFVCDSLESYVSAIHRLPEIHSVRCRNHAVDSFGLDAYGRALQALLEVR